VNAYIQDFDPGDLVQDRSFYWSLKSGPGGSDVSLFFPAKYVGPSIPANKHIFTGNESLLAYADLAGPDYPRFICIATANNHDDGDPSGNPNDSHSFGCVFIVSGHIVPVGPHWKGLNHKMS
jgi:hypothetical protein